MSNLWQNKVVYTTSTTTSAPVQLIFQKSHEEVWLDALFKLLEKGYEIDIVTGGVIHA